MLVYIRTVKRYWIKYLGITETSQSKKNVLRQRFLRFQGAGAKKREAKTLQKIDKYLNLKYKRQSRSSLHKFTRV